MLSVDLGIITGTQCVEKKHKSVTKSTFHLCQMIFYCIYQFGWNFGVFFSVAFALPVFSQTSCLITVISVFITFKTVIKDKTCICLETHSEVLFYNKPLLLYAPPAWLQKEIQNLSC